MITVMATRIGKGRKPHLYLTEHIEAKGMNQNKIALKLDVNRSTVGKWLKKGQNISLTELDQIAFALDYEDYRVFYRPPGEPSVDEELDGQPSSVRAAVATFVKNLKAARG